MFVVGIMKILGWCQVVTGRGTYTCPIKEINGEDYFKFKGEWHKIVEYLYNNK